MARNQDQLNFRCTYLHCYIYPQENLCANNIMDGSGNVNIRQICISNNFKEMCTYTENIVQILIQL